MIKEKLFHQLSAGSKDILALLYRGRPIPAGKYPTYNPPLLASGYARVNNQGDLEITPTGHCYCHMVMHFYGDMLWQYGKWHRNLTEK